MSMLMLHQAAKRKDSGRTRWLWLLCLTLCSSLSLSGCATLQQLAALRQVEFRMAGIDGLRLAGVELGQQRSLSDFGALDLTRLTAAFAEGRLPLRMRIAVEAKNPAENSSSASFLKMDWNLRLAGKDTVAGSFAQAMTLSPGVPATIPVAVELELLNFFGNNLGDLVRLVGGITGVSSERTELELFLSPTIDTPLGPMLFPEPVRVAWAAGGS